MHCRFQYSSNWPDCHRCLIAESDFLMPVRETVFQWKHDCHRGAIVCKLQEPHNMCLRTSNYFGTVTSTCCTPRLKHAWVYSSRAFKMVVKRFHIVTCKNYLYIARRIFRKRPALTVLKASAG